MGILQEQIPVWIIMWSMISLILFYALAYSRDHSGRKEFMHTVSLKKGIQALEDESIANEKALLSTLTDSLFEALLKDRFSSFESVAKCVLVYITIQYPHHFYHTPDTPLKFKEISDLIKSMEGMVKSFGMEVIKSTATTYAIVSKHASGKQTHETEYITQAMHLCFQAQLLLHRISNLHALHGLQYKICSDTGSIAYGLIGKHEFTFDYFGGIVTRCQHMSMCVDSGGVYISEELDGLIGRCLWIESSVYEATKSTHKGQNRMGRIYRMEQVADVLGVFVGSIEWMENYTEDETRRKQKKEKEDGWIEDM